LLKKTMPVRVTINSETTEGEPGPSLFDYAERIGVRVPTSCHKQGKCRECLVEVLEGLNLLSPPAPEEKHLKGNFRLSCRCHVIAGSGNIRCQTLRRGSMQIEHHAVPLPAALASCPPDPSVTRAGDWIHLDTKALVRSSGPIYGLAMDLGTTTIALRLVDLETGELVARSAFENPQRFGGSDVMARILFDTNNPGRLLQRTLVGYLSHAIAELPVDPKCIYELVVAGNATMRDLFFGLNVHGIGQKPYQSLREREMRAGKRSTTSLSTTARQLHLPLCPDARVYGMPLVSGHVGADAAACLLAMNMAEEERLVALMDIGTNTELILGNKHKIMAASCPAGPAFEGGAIGCGMPALEGAIERIALREDGQIETKIIGGLPPAGICGSGLVDLLSELLRTERMNSLGRFAHGPEHLVVDAERQIRLCEEDISQLAQAKGANVAGLQILFKNYGARFEDVEVFYFAGGFARHLDIQAAQRIGLLPQIDPSRIVQAGNMAAQGATVALLSISRREQLEQLVRRVRHVELELDPEFFDYFVSGCQFQPVVSADCAVSGND
jgi:uncharacterized 2Fe-2S/4Fe-4S cluster protein (DUF4445 family)